MLIVALPFNDYSKKISSLHFHSKPDIFILHGLELEEAELQ
jgi:hypothetical protein